MQSVLNTTIPIWWRLRWQLIVAFVLLAVLPVVVVATITVRLTRERLATQALSQLESIADLKRDQITGWLNDSRAGLELLLSPDVRADLIALAQSAAPTTTAQAHIGVLLQGATNPSRPEGQRSVRFQSLFLYTPAGQIIAASDARLVGRLVTQQPYFAPSLQAEHLQPPYYAVGSNELVVVMTQRLQAADSRTVAILGGQLDLAVLGDLMAARSGLVASGETYLVSRESHYLLTPSRYPGYVLTRSYHSAGIDQVLRGEDGRGTYANYSDPPELVMGVYRWVPELQAGLLAEMAQADALAAADQVQRLSTLVMAAASLLAILTGLLIATRLAGPIVQLTQMAVRIAGGAFDQRVQLRQRNEVGVLAAGFNHMATGMQQMLGGLEQRVAERTAALQAALADLEVRTATQAKLLAALDQERAIVRELSVPVIPISTTTLILPLIGALDSARLRQLQDQALRAIERTTARTLVLDITGVPMVDTHVAQGLVGVVEAARLLGTQVLLVGIRPEVAQAIVGLGLQLHSVHTFMDLQSALLHLREV